MQLLLFIENDGHWESSLSVWENLKMYFPRKTIIEMMIEGKEKLSTRSNLADDDFLLCRQTNRVPE